MVNISVDVGGTFTDVVCTDDGQFRDLVKVPTTHGDIVQGIIYGTQEILRKCGLSPQDVVRFIHSSTIATNAVLEQRGARIALLTTQGFEDVLEIGRQKRSELYDLGLRQQTPVFLAPRRLRVGIRERINSDGKVILPLAEDMLIEQVGRVIQSYNIECIAVVYLFSFINDTHEKRTKQLIEKHFPGLPVSLSCEVEPVFREFERTCVTAFDAYVRPTVSSYIRKLTEALLDIGITSGLLVMQSRGGLAPSTLATERPVGMLLSGPAAGVVGARYVGALSSHSNLITVDIGGTSCDVALVKDGKPILSREGHIGPYPLRMSLVDVETIAAGGGSIVSFDKFSGLRVGEHSAGSVPGPVCYGRGGTQLTVTDASLYLGYLNPKFFAGGTLALDIEGSRKALEGAAESFGLAPEVLASGTHRIVNERIASEIRLASVKKGHDPRQFALVALGGAGPVHSSRLARLLSIPTVIVPYTPGVLAAFGLAVSRIENEQTQTIGRSTRDVDAEMLRRAFAQLDLQCAEKMVGYEQGKMNIHHTLDMRYKGQSFELDVPIAEAMEDMDIAAIQQEFGRLYRLLFGYTRHDLETEIVNIRTVHQMDTRAAPRFVRTGADRPDRPPEPVAMRSAHFDDGGGFRDTPVYTRSSLSTGHKVCGPAIIEQTDTTLVLYPGDVARTDAELNIIVETGLAP